ncbi:MAG: CoA pyrophosphatase [Cyclobacteriaceae bacterium]|nr:CoA pyrophosphatase [Cyclobacteriaceae bacterium]UYN85498.1 MAG: CoA pyrophosphatase [Cyclobacteriaceae bacterium]
MMDLLTLVGKLQERLKAELPGAKAHELLRATPVGSVLPTFQHQLPPKPGSVLILLYPETNELFFPLIKRPDYPGAHSGQVSLPGGKAEPGETQVETALREAQEEIGINPAMVKVLGKLSDFFVIPSNFMVTPVVGVAEGKPTLVADAHEVVKILNARIYDILAEDAVKTREILAAGRYKMMAPHFEVEGEIVWGATAMMLNELRWLLRELTTG